MYDTTNSNEGTAPQGIRTSVSGHLSADSARRRALIADPYEAADRFCISYCGTSRHLKICPLGIGGPELLPRDAIHTSDSQCTVDPATGCCTGCGVEFGAPCATCSGRGYHNEGCPEIER